MVDCRALPAAGTLTNVVSAASRFMGSRTASASTVVTAAAAPAKASRLARVAEGATNGAMAVTSLATLFTAMTGFGKSDDVVVPKVVSYNLSYNQ